MSLLSLYIDPYMYQRSPSGLESNSLISDLTLIGSPGVVLGATQIPVIAPGVTATQYLNSRIIIFDGPSSEIVTVTAIDPLGTNIIQCTPTLASHVANTPLCSDGALGSLADQIISASAWVENITQQSLWQKTYTNENIKIPSLRGAIDNQNQLVFSPRHFPISAENGITIMQNNTNPVSYDATQCIIDQDAQVVSVPYLTTSGSGVSTYAILPTMTRYSTLYLQITYTAGFAQGNLPADIMDACILLTSDLLSRRENPTGAADRQVGDYHLTANLRGDTSGESVLFKQARQKLQPYTRTVT